MRCARRRTLTRGVQGAGRRSGLPPPAQAPGSGGCGPEGGQARAYVTGKHAVSELACLAPVLTGKVAARAAHTGGGGAPGRARRRSGEAGLALPGSTAKGLMQGPAQSPLQALQSAWAERVYARCAPPALARTGRARSQPLSRAALSQPPACARAQHPARAPGSLVGAGPCAAGQRRHLWPAAGGRGAWPARARPGPGARDGPACQDAGALLAGRPGGARHLPG